jgi:hypothetical protein
VFKPSDVRSVESAIARFRDERKTSVPEILARVVIIDAVKNAIT